MVNLCSSSLALSRNNSSLYNWGGKTQIASGNSQVETTLPTGAAKGFFIAVVPVRAVVNVLSYFLINIVRLVVLLWVEVAVL